MCTYIISDHLAIHGQDPKVAVSLRESAGLSLATDAMGAGHWLSRRARWARLLYQ